MFCPRCGSNQSDQAQFCNCCGLHLQMIGYQMHSQQSGTYYQQNYGYTQQTGTYYQQPYGYTQQCGTYYQQPNAYYYGQPYGYTQQTDAYYQQTTPFQPGTEAAARPKVPLGWYYFLLVWIMIDVVLGFFNGFSCILGGHYYSEAAKELVYHTYDGIQTVDILMGFVNFALSGFGLYVWFRLFQFRLGATNLAVWLHVAYSAVNLLYLFTLFLLIGSSFAEIYNITLTVINVILYAVYAVVSAIYFKSRTFLFDK